MKCKYCKQEMNKVNGCKFTHIKIDKKNYKRSLESWNQKRCGDCGAKVGFPHHYNCDVERCPKCKGQLISCECNTERLMYNITKIK